MTTKQLDAFYRGILDIGGFAASDASLNGLQVDNDGAQVERAAFAVDACMASFKAAAQAGAGLLFVHHGLFWGVPAAMAGGLRERLEFLLAHNIALYAAHLPLDAHPTLGNNAVLAGLLGMEDIEPFGEYHGRKIGFKGRLREPLSVDEAASRIAFMGRPAAGLFPFGKAKSETCAVVSGGAAYEVRQALAEGLDLYVTGESGHGVYHECLEGGINIVAGGHYNTEVWGVRKMMEETGRSLGIDAVFIDLPTGL
jgi:dinuclear metal center YbgI/SA1388 family protein